MNKSLEPDLTSLLPSLAGPVPSELLDLATSLLSQSRQRISNLKPAEEIARSYVCAHIACDRLKNKLDLPVIEPHPPLPKRAYNTLLSHFTKALLTQSAAVGGSSSSAASSRANPSPPTLDAQLADELTALCTALRVPAAAPHILTGVASILSDRSNSRVKGIKTIFAICVATAILVIERLSPHEREIQVGDITWKRGSGYKAKQKEIMAKLVETAGKERAGGIVRLTVDDWIQKLSKQGLRKWSWMEKIPDGGGVEGAGAVVSPVKRIGERPGTVSPVKKAVERPVEKTAERGQVREAAVRRVLVEAAAKVAAKTSVKAAVKTAAKAATKSTPKTPTKPKQQPQQQPEQQPEPTPKKRKVVQTAAQSELRRKRSKIAGEAGGGGRMLQEKVDYLSERRKKAYVIWKKTIIEQCLAIENRRSSYNGEGDETDEEVDEETVSPTEAAKENGASMDVSRDEVMV